MFKRIWSTIKKGFRKVGNFFKEGFRIMTTPLKELTWPKRIAKLLGMVFGIGLGIYLFILLLVFLVYMLAVVVFIGGFIFSLGGPIEHGTNEVLGRNRKKRYYY